MFPHEFYHAREQIRIVELPHRAEHDQRKLAKCGHGGLASAESGGWSARLCETAFDAKNFEVVAVLEEVEERLRVCEAAVEFDGGKVIGVDKAGGDHGVADVKGEGTKGNDEFRLEECWACGDVGATVPEASELGHVG